MLSVFIFYFEFLLIGSTVVSNFIPAVEEDAESEDEEEEDVKLLSVSGKRSAPGGGSKVPQVETWP
jgi:hypothetical protein